MELESEYQESVAITFEWTLKGLKNMFESTKGESKSKVTKSLRFGEGRWQILFYANAGTSKEGVVDGGFVSLYLSCEPTAEEKEAALADSGRWVREGVFKFSFELRNIGKTVLYNLKEAHNHSFSHKTANWGWAQFARRDNIYYQSNPVKAQDAFVIICTITSSPSAPHPPPALPLQSVPKGLLDTVGALLDDPNYSDVEFLIPRRGQSLKHARRIWASRRLLKRAEYFEAMFSPSFAEGMGHGSALPHIQSRAETNAALESGYVANEFEDSDYEDDDAPDDYQSDFEQDHSCPSGTLESLATSIAENILDDDDMDTEDQRNVKAKLSHPSSPRNTHLNGLPSNEFESDSKSKPLTVVVRDVAYNTYLAVLYYIYTDTIVFAPLSSSFNVMSKRSPSTPTLSLPPTPSEPQGHVTSNKRTASQDFATSRQEWIREWVKNNPGRPAPCSAKAAYRLADKLDLRELKERASQHILKSLTVDNIAYEVFSPFAATFDEIRKVQVAFFLAHWQDIRASDPMRNVWQQIRNGRHPGFEEVWPVIAQSLEFKPVAANRNSASKD